MSLREGCWGARWEREWEFREQVSILRPLVGPGVCCNSVSQKEHIPDRHTLWKMQIEWVVALFFQMRKLKFDEVK